MRFGLLVGHQLPRPWHAGDERRLVEESFAQIARAEAAGFERVWALEHHHLEEYAHSSAPAVFLGAVSQRSERIRLGLANVALATACAGQVAEAVATLDLVSGGRADLAVGTARLAVERGGAPADPAESDLATVARMLVEEPFAGAGETLPPCNIVPKPVQDPHPSLALAGTRREIARRAGEQGAGVLALSPLEPDEAADWVGDHRAALGSERCVPAGFAVNPTVSVVLPAMVCLDEAEAIARGIDGAHFAAYALAHYAVFGAHRPGRTDLWSEFLDRRDDAGFARGAVVPDGRPLSVRVMGGGRGSLRGAIGTPEQVRELLGRYEEAGVDEVVLVLQAGRTEHAHVCETIELLGSEVLPVFLERADLRESRRDDGLAAAMHAAMARRPLTRDPDPAYVVRAGEEPVTAAAAASAPAASAASAAPPPRRGTRPRAAALRRAALVRGERAFRGWVERADDARVERVAGSRPALRAIFRGMEAAYVPGSADGWAGDLLYELTGSDGRVHHWTVHVDGARAIARPGRAEDPALTVVLGVADFARLAAGDLDPGAALLSGRLDVKGDFALATRLGEMFGLSLGF